VTQQGFGRVIGAEALRHAAELLALQAAGEALELLFS
jgi:hypothetical protein